MAKPLSLFIRPPYKPASGATGETWSLVYGYGPDPSAPATAPVFRNHALLRSTGACQVRAAVGGKLSVRPPGLVPNDPYEGVNPVDADEPLPPTIDLYIAVSPEIAEESAFKARAAAVGGIVGFVYFNIDTDSIAPALQDQLDRLFDPPGFFSRDLLLRLLLKGRLDLKIQAGQVFGAGATQGAPAGSRQVGFTVLTPTGPLDPAHSYDLMREFVEDGQAGVDAFLGLVPKRWPVIDPALGTAEAIALTANTLYAMPVLEQLRTSRALSRDQWRQVGDNQKALYRGRLLKRVGRFTGTNPPPPFEFDDVDWQNVFQLESVVELFANFDDPWAATATLRAPGDANYVTVDFLDYEGAAATSAAHVVTLDGSAPLDRLWVGRDKLLLESDTSKPGHLFTITAVNTTAHTVTVDGTPVLTGGTSRWRIRKRPVVVLIDSFGAREGLSGTAATVDSANQDVIKLNGGTEKALYRVNKKFDTVYLPSDTARPSRTYRVLDVNAKDKTLKLDGKPTFQGGSSAWHVPAGLSGELPPFTNPYDVGPSNAPTSPSARGNDHYDGMAFVLDEGRVHGRVRFSSYTSRRHDFNTEASSSIRGNRRYYVRSMRSGNAFKNYSFRVEDPKANPDDTVAEARYYFRDTVAVDSNGKGLIRLHHGLPSNNAGGFTSGTGSEGCVVSPTFYELRRLLVDRYQSEYAVLHPPNGQDAQIQKAANAMSHAAGVALYNLGNAAAGLTYDNWTDKIFAILWLIRPDERPL